jgi:hypothetical protein
MDRTINLCLHRSIQLDAEELECVRAQSHALLLMFSVLQSLSSALLMVQLDDEACSLDTKLEKAACSATCHACSS